MPKRPLSGWIVALACGGPARPMRAAEPPEAATEGWSPIQSQVAAPSGKPLSDAVVLFDGISVRPDGTPWKSRTAR